MNLIEHLERQKKFSKNTFGPGSRAAGICGHIRKELEEIEDAPEDLNEWVDVVLLALDGAWRAGYTPEEISAAIEAKQTKNEGRTWPDWRTSEPGKAIEHVRDSSELLCGEMAEATSLPAPLCRWWARTRPCRNADQLNAGDGMPAVLEFYVPWWAWPLELLHRMVFGRSGIDA